MSSYRPRRTRIYGANYDIGESYYKPAIQRLDNKPAVVRYTPNVFLIDDRTEPSIPKSQLNEERKPKVGFFEENIDDEYVLPNNLSLARKHLARGSDLQTDYNDVKNLFKKPLFDEDEQDFQVNSVRQIKLRSQSVFQDESSVTEAASRVKQTRARLADLESEIQGIADKQTEREQRKLHLKKILSEKYDE